MNHGPCIGQTYRQWAKYYRCYRLETAVAMSFIINERVDEKRRISETHNWLSTFDIHPNRFYCTHFLHDSLEPIQSKIHIGGRQRIAARGVRVEAVSQISQPPARHFPPPMNMMSDYGQ